MKQMKKLLCCILATTLLVQTCSGALAASYSEDVFYSEDGVRILENVYLLENSSDESVVMEITDTGYTLSSYNRITNIEIVEKYDENGELLSTETIDFNNTEIPTTITTVTDYQHTFSNREYEIDATNSPPTWVCIKLGLRKDRMQTSGSMEAALFAFKGAVDRLNEEEIILAGLIGIAGVFDVILAMSSGGVGAAIALYADEISIIEQVVKVSNATNLADEKFDAIP